MGSAPALRRSRNPTFCSETATKHGGSSYSNELGFVTVSLGTGLCEHQFMRLEGAGYRGSGGQTGLPP